MHRAARQQCGELLFHREPEVFAIDLQTFLQLLHHGGGCQVERGEHALVGLQIQDGFLRFEERIKRPLAAALRHRQGIEHALVARQLRAGHRHRVGRQLGHEKRHLGCERLLNPLKNTRQSRSACHESGVGLAAKDGLVLHLRVVAHPLETQLQPKPRQRGHRLHLVVFHHQVLERLADVGHPLAEGERQVLACAVLDAGYVGQHLLDAGHQFGAAQKFQ